MSTRKISLIFTVFFLSVLGAHAQSTSSQNTNPNQPAGTSSTLLARQYQDGEKLSYHMMATNKDRLKTLSYEAQADGIVKKDAAGHFFEEFQWSGLIWNGQALAIPPANADFRQILSLDPGFKPQFPDMRKAFPALVGPVLDLMTFYVDLNLAIHNGELNHPGDHAYVKLGIPASWAAGEGLILGEDSIDFDLTLREVDFAAKTATLLVRHVPPAQPAIHIPTAWMHEPVADTANNWVEVGKNADGTYTASIGKETFDDVIKLSLVDGRVLSATMDNPVEVLERKCTDAALASCGDPIRYEIHRQIEIH